MTIDEAIQTIRELENKNDEYEEQLESYGEIIDELNEHLTDAFEKIRELQNQIPKWHLCSEELPGVSDTYIVACIKGKGLICTSFATFQSKYKKWNLTGARAYWRVNAWIELPKFEEVE